MAKFAVVSNGVVRNVVEAEADFAATQGWIAVPDGASVSKGDLFDGTNFVKVLPPDEVTGLTPVSVFQFYLLFTSGERDDLEVAKTTTPSVANFTALLADPRVDKINLQDTAVIEFLTQLVTAGVLTESRKTQIQGGVK